MKSKKQGPTREQLTDQQWSAVCNCFDTIERIVRKYRHEVTNGQSEHVCPTPTAALR